MVVIFTLPVFIAFGITYQAGLFFYANTLFALFALAINASAVSTLLVMVAVILVPATRMKSIFIFMGILFFVFMYLAIRLLRPELLVDPEVFDTVLVYITSLQTPSSPLLPSTWAYDSIKTALDRVRRQRTLSQRTFLELCRGHGLHPCDGFQCDLF